ncbi:MAG: ABC transporter ATP-binding protein [Propionibacteriales bacterium]|nr:ABC transporter ATP-binding protein [Propionibacteriales bacterium]
MSEDILRGPGLRSAEDRRHPDNSTDSLLSVRDLRVVFTRRGEPSTVAVDEVSFDIRGGEHLGLVGESGSGKSVTSLAIMGLLPARGAEVSGAVVFDGENLLTAKENRMREVRGRDIAMVFQDPMTSLNPVVTIGTQISEVIRSHRQVDKREATERSVELLSRVSIPDPGRRIKEYPHQLSGGMRQRVLIAIALANEPRLLIADEPTTALDVTIQAQILEILKAVVADTGSALIMITHDLGVVAGLCDTVHVMYQGRVVESAARRPLFAEPHHPYTGGLLASVPRLDTPRGGQLLPIPGSPTDVLLWTQGCAFAPRCSNRIDICSEKPPALESDGNRALRCYNPLESDPVDKEQR